MSYRLQCRICAEDKYKDCVWRKSDIGGILSLLGFVPENKVTYVTRFSFCGVFFCFMISSNNYLTWEKYLRWKYMSKLLILAEIIF